MLIKHSALYFSGRVIPGAVGLIGLALYTRLADAVQYGQYALVVAAISVINAVCFQWLSLVVDRFYPIHARKPQALLSTMVVAYVALVVATGMLGIAVAWLWAEETIFWLVLLAVVIAWIQAWFDLSLRIISARLLPIRYGLLGSVKALLALGLGTLLLSLGFGAPGMLVGLMLGLVLAATAACGQWQGVGLRHYDARLFGELATYGGPMALTIMLASILDVSDRFMLGWLLNVKAAGAYAAVYDLTQQSLGMLMGIVYLAGFPLVIRALEGGDLNAARTQMRQNSFVSLAVALPATLGTVISADNIAFTLLGADFRNGAGMLITCIALAVFVWGVKSHYLDYAFQFTRRTKLQIWPVALAAVVNLLLNYFLIPNYGLQGAAWATLAGCIAGAMLSWHLGSRIFSYPKAHEELHKVVAAAIGMGIILLFAREWRGPSALLCQILLGMFSNGLLIVALNANGARTRLQAWLIPRAER